MVPSNIVFYLRQDSCTAPNVPPLRALWSLLDGIWGIVKGSWEVLADPRTIQNDSLV